MSLLYQLYYGKLQPGLLDMPTGTVYARLSEEVDRRTDQWRAKLTPEEFRDLDGLLSACNQCKAEECAQSFVYGYRLGTAMTAEALTGRNNLALP